MVTVLPSLAAIEPRSRVTGLCAMAAAAAMKATAAATQPASRRMGVIGILPGDTGLWHGSRRARVYDCVMGLWVKVPLISRRIRDRGPTAHGVTQKNRLFSSRRRAQPPPLVLTYSKFQAGGSFARRRVKVSLDYYFNFTYIGLRSNPNGEITHAHRGRPRPPL